MESNVNAYKNKETALKQELKDLTDAVNRKDQNCQLLQVSETKLTKEKAALKLQIDALLLEKANAGKREKDKWTNFSLPNKSSVPNSCLNSPPPNNNNSNQLNDALERIATVFLAFYYSSQLNAQIKAMQTPPTTALSPPKQNNSDDKDKRINMLNTQVCRLENENIARLRKSDRERDDLNEKLKDLARDLSESQKMLKESQASKSADLESLKKSFAKEKTDFTAKITRFFVD